MVQPQNRLRRYDLEIPCASETADQGFGDARSKITAVVAA
jgi:hypothetical protein